MKPGRIVNTDERLSALWSALKLECCVKPDEAKMIVFLGEEKFRKAIAPLLDSQAAGEYDTRVMNEIRERVTDGYESASSRNVSTVAALTLKDLHYVLSSHDGQCRRGATQMRDKCVDVAEDYRQRIEYEDDEGVREAMFGDMVMKMESLTFDQVVEKQ